MTEYIPNDLSVRSDNFSVGTGPVVTFHTEDGRVGVNTPTPNEELTIAGDISASGIYYGNGSGLTNLAAAAAPDTEVRGLTANWENTYTNVQSNSSTNWDNSLANQYTHINFLPLSGGTLTGTLINDVSATGSFYGDGSKLTGIVAGDTVATTLVRSNSANWDSTYTNVQSNSANWEGKVDSNITGIAGATSLTNMMQITLTGYNAITPAVNTLYIIVG
jgi:hypothetical protein